jgi:PiT family inorganic phosphate transporter
LQLDIQLMPCKRMARRASAVRWNVAQEIVIAWVVTMPAAALIGALFYGLASLIG